MLLPLAADAVAALGVLAQSQTDVGSGLLGSAVATFLGTLIVGGIMVVAFTDYTRQRIRELREEPVGSLLYGLVALVALIVIMILLAITIVGILVVIPLAIVAYLLWIVGAAIAYVAIGDRLVGHEDGWLKPLLVGAAINGVLVLTGIGGLVSFVIGAAGFGAVLRSWL